MTEPDAEYESEIFQAGVYCALGLLLIQSTSYAMTGFNDMLVVWAGIILGLSGAGLLAKELWGRWRSSGVETV